MLSIYEMIYGSYGASVMAKRCCGIFMLLILIALMALPSFGYRPIQSDQLASILCVISGLTGLFDLFPRLFFEEEVKTG